MSYVFVVAPENYPGRTYSFGNRILEHHLVWWENTGECVGDGNVIHHKNEIKTDNRFENLEIMTRSEHTAHHGTIGDIVVLKCDCCGVEFSRQYCKIKKSAKKQYCSTKCSASMTSARKLSDEVKTQIKELSNSGMSSYGISEKLGISRTTVMKYW